MIGLGEGVVVEEVFVELEEHRSSEEEPGTGVVDRTVARSFVGSQTVRRTVRRMAENGSHW